MDVLRVLSAKGFHRAESSSHISAMKTQNRGKLKWTLWLPACALLVQAQCKQVHRIEPLKERTIVSYNVENLFDTVDDPNTDDAEYNAGGKLQWDEAKYTTKLQHIAQVMQAIDSTGPAIIGLCEVESEKSLRDLVNQPFFKTNKYAFVHRDSPDERGVDVALLYRSREFKVQSTKWYNVPLEDPNDRTREILYVSGELNGYPLHVFVNHWPSRSKGQAASEPDRIAAARVLRSKLDSITAGNADARIICMGDFNDHPDDKSMRETLSARSRTDASSAYVNEMWGVNERKEGSHFYKGEWGALDQFVVSKPMTSANTGITVVGEGSVWKNKLVLFYDKEGNGRPNRTYVGNDYKGGYSDHLPILLKVMMPIE